MTIKWQRFGVPLRSPDEVPPPLEVMVGEHGCVRAFHSCEAFHKLSKPATMVDEKTFSHYFRKPNSFIPGGRPYAIALAEKLLELKLLGGDSPSVVEVGGGLGDVASNALPVFLARCPKLSYTMVDPSPNLLSAQRVKLSPFGGRVRFLEGNAERLGEVASGVDFLLSNEVLADLTTITNIPNNPNDEEQMNRVNRFADENTRWWGVARDYIKKYDLTVYSHFRLGDEIPSINYGAFRMIEQLPQVLSPQGTAFLVEYATGNTVRKRLRGHEEYSILTENLIKVAEANGFQVKSGRLIDLLGIDPEKKHVDVNTVNIWLMTGQNPEELVAQGEEGYRKAFHLAHEYANNVEKYSQLDCVLTDDEFRKLAAEKGWDIPNPKMKKIGDSFGVYKYFELRKK